MEFPSNSHAAKPKAEKPVIEKVVTGAVVTRPKSIGSRFRGIFLSGDFRTARGYVIGDVLLPALRNMVADGTSKFVERMVYGDSAGRRRSPMGYSGPQVSYNRLSSTSYNQSSRGRPAMLPDQPPFRVGQHKKQAGDIILVSREEATEVLERLIDIVDKYEQASLADLNNLVGLPSTFVDENWGWTSLGNSDIRQIREGYLLELPPIESLV